MCPERKELMLGEKPKILSLDDVGTRYEHYQELRELFSDGVEVVKTAMTYQPDNAVSKRRLESLQHAVNEIDHRIEVLSGYDEHANRWSKFGRELDSIKPNVTALSEGSNVQNPEVTPEVKPEIKPLPPCPNRNREDIKNSNDYCADFETSGIKLRYIDEGVFRKVYKISGCPLVVKFPLDNDGIQHSVSEMRRIRRLGRIKELLPHLPKVLYFNGKSGIVVMEYYKALDPEKGVELLGKVIKKLVSRIAKVAMSDIHSDNIRQGRRGEIVVFSDLGY